LSHSPKNKLKKCNSAPINELKTNLEFTRAIQHMGVPQQQERQQMWQGPLMTSLPQVTKKKTPRSSLECHDRVMSVSL